MTLAVAVVTADGIAIAADSRTTIAFTPADGQQPLQQRVSSDFTHKVFQAGDVAVATHGYALINRRNVAGHVEEFVQSLAEHAAPKNVAELVCEFFGERLDKHYEDGFDTPPAPGENVLGFLVGGFEDGLGVLYEVTLPTRTVLRLSDSTTGGAAWRGQTDVVSRLIKGIDLDLLQRIAAGGPNEAHVQALQEPCKAMEYIIPFGSMNLQDAIDFAVLAIRTTIDIQRLSHGVVGVPGSWPGVGGPIEIASVLPHEGFQWVQRTQLQGERPAGEAVRI